MRNAPSMSLDAPAATTRPGNWRLEAALYALICGVLAFDALHLLDQLAATQAAVPGLQLDRALILISALALLGFGTASARRREVGRGLAVAIGAACGLLFFARTLGSALADPGAIGWLLNNDLAQHYSGWAMFRSAPWHWPPGLLPELWYPVGTSIAYTDSLPLLALLFKPISPWLPEPFQYIGLWLLTNYVLQGAFAALLLTRATRHPATILAGTALFVFAPLLLSRLGHDTLTTQWLLLAGLWLYFRKEPPKSLIAEAWPWWLLGAVAVLVHPYLTAMTLAIQAAYWLKRIRLDRARSLREAAIGFGVALAILLPLFWLSGAMVIHTSDSSGGVPYGRYSFNLLGFFNPMGYSRVLPTLPYLPDQYEGFAFAGIGVLGLGAWLLLDGLVRYRRLPMPEPAWRPLALVALLLCLFAASSVLAVGSWVLIDWPIKNRLFGAFRSSGRFVWVAYYALILLVIWTVLKRYRPLLAAGLLGLALIVQMADLSTMHQYYAKSRLKANLEVPGTQLLDPRWAQLAQGRRHLTLLPPPSCGEAVGSYLPFQLLAARHHLTFNSGYLARWNAKATQQYCGELTAQADAGAWSKDEIYVLGKDARWRSRFEHKPPPFACETLDGYEACVLADGIDSIAPSRAAAD